MKNHHREAVMNGTRRVEKRKTVAFVGRIFVFGRTKGKQEPRQPLPMALENAWKENNGRGGVGKFRPKRKQLGHQARCHFHRRSPKGALIEKGRPRERRVPGLHRNGHSGKVRDVKAQEIKPMRPEVNASKKLWDEDGSGGMNPVWGHPNTTAQVVRSLVNDGSARNVDNFQDATKCLFQGFNVANDSLEIRVPGGSTVGDTTGCQVVREVEQGGVA